MKMINPKEISSKILTLMEESNERVILVSPYVRIHSWFKLQNSLKRLVSRRIQLDIYVRDEPQKENPHKDLKEMGLAYKKVPYLHSKFYMNEKYGIVTSMNLLLSSDTNALEIGYITETRNEYLELLGYFDQYVHPGKPPHFDTVAGRSTLGLQALMNLVKEGVENKGLNAWPWYEKNAMHLCTGRNRYKISIQDGILKVSAVLNSEGGGAREIPLLKNILKDKARMDVNIQPGFMPYTMVVEGSSPLPLKTFVVGVEDTETDALKESLVEFIEVATDLFPEDYGK